MGFLTGGKPPQTDLEIVLDFLFEAIEGWSAQFRTQEINRKMYAAAEAFQRMKESGAGAPVPGQVPGSERGSQTEGGAGGKEEAVEGRKGQQGDALRRVGAPAVSDAERNAAKERMAKARAVRAANLAAKKAAQGRGT